MEQQQIDDYLNQLNTAMLETEEVFENIASGIQAAMQQYLDVLQPFFDTLPDLGEWDE